MCHIDFGACHTTLVVIFKDATRTAFRLGLYIYLATGLQIEKYEEISDTRFLRMLLRYGRNSKTYYK